MTAADVYQHMAMACWLAKAEGWLAHRRARRGIISAAGQPAKLVQGRGVAVRLCGDELGKIVSVKSDLHELVDRLAEEQAADLLAYLRRLLAASEQNDESAAARLARRMEPLTVSGQAFFAERPLDLQAMAAAQGVRPVARFDDLLGDFWPDDETADEFIAAVRQWRHEGGYA